MFASLWLFCQFDCEALGDLFYQMPSQLAEPTFRSYGIGLMLLSLAVLSIFEMFLSYIINLFRLTLIVLLVCLIGAEFLVWSHGDDAPEDYIEIQSLDSWE